MPHIRGVTIPVRRMTRAFIAGGAEHSEQPGKDYQRPRTFGECQRAGLGTEVPCPFVSCRFHLALNINPKNGSIKVMFPGVEVEDMPETCTLAVADRGGLAHEVIGAFLNLSRSRAQQLEASGMSKMSRAAKLRDYVGVVTCGEACEADDASGASSTADAVDALSSLSDMTGAESWR